VTFAFDRFRIAVRSRQATHVAWLAEFLSPWFAPGAAGPAAATVAFRVAPGGPGPPGAPGGRADPPTDVDCFVLDSRVVRHPAWPDPGGGWTVLDRELDALYRVGPERRRVAVIARGGPPAARVALMRVVRELAMVAALGAGAVLLHAGALVRGGAAVLLVGPKRAGKTTLLLRALAARGTAFMANDRVAVRPAGLVARGMPSIVSIRPEVLAALDRVGPHLRARGYHHAVTMAEARPPTEWRPGKGADLSPAQLCDVLGVAAAPAAPVRAVVFPAACPGLGRVCLEPLPGPAALPRLLDNLFGGRPTPASRLFGGDRLDRAAVAEAAEEGCRRILDGAPAFACRFDPTVLDEAGAATIIGAALG
jgi:hypothetical protein